ncbi:hypothetical protein ACLOJK_004932 [Asimina triloba]
MVASKGSSAHLVWYSSGLKDAQSQFDAEADGGGDGFPPDAWWLTNIEEDDQGVDRRVGFFFKSVATKNEFIGVLDLVSKDAVLA